MKIKHIKAYPTSFAIPPANRVALDIGTAIKRDAAGANHYTSVSPLDRPGLGRGEGRISPEASTHRRSWIPMKRLLLAFTLAAPLAALAQTYPSKPIRWVVPYPGGGITDSVTRIVTQKMAASLGQPIVVDNRPGANSILGTDLVAKAAPDGYTVLTVIAGHAANATLYQGKLSYDPQKSFAPISLAGIAPLILTVSNSFPAKDVKELIAYAKANPGKVNFGSSGIGAAAHLT